MRGQHRDTDEEAPPPVLNENGFSLLEVFVAIAILSVGMLGVGAMLHISMDFDRVNARQRIVYREANAKIEEIKSRSTSPDFADGMSGTEYYGAEDATGAQKWSTTYRPSDSSTAGDWLRRDFRVENNPTLRQRQITVDMFQSGGYKADVGSASVDQRKYKLYTAVSYVK
jgi:prepilin-type N-terminal cleavage/methylation domain-containing protein